MRYMYAFCKHEANLELITNTNSLVKISSIMMEWSMRIINMLLYEYGEILTRVSIAVTNAAEGARQKSKSVYGIITMLCTT